MEINTFWKIVLKSIGLWLLVNCIYVIPQFIASFSFTAGVANVEGLVLVIAGNLIVMILLLLIIRIFLFKTDWLINLLKLEKSFNQQKIDISISTSTVLSIVVIITSAIIFLQSLPVLVQELFQFFKQEKLLKDYLDTPWIVYHFIRTLVSYLAMTNSGTIVKWINNKSDENKT